VSPHGYGHRVQRRRIRKRRADVRYFLDSTFVIDFLRGDASAIERYRRLFDDGDEPVVNEIVVCEVATGAPPRDAHLQAFLEPVEFLQPGPDVAVLAGTWRAAARRRGRSLSLADALIAAAAGAAEATLLTRNASDFALTPIRVEPY
jgi:predicted nucleic acid-binding protein